MLAATNCGPCNTCSAKTSYFVNDYNIYRKRRPPKPEELLPKTKDVAWSLSKKRGRTAKHKQPWNADSGATISCTNDASSFESIDEISPRIRIQVANGQFIVPTMVGTVKLNLRDADNNPYVVLLKNVYYSPNFAGPLLSVDQLYEQHRICTLFKGSKACLITADGVQLPLERDQKHRYMLHAYAAVAADSELWHRRFMHVGRDSLRRMSCVIPSISKSADFTKCDACLQGGSVRKPINLLYSRRRNNWLKTSKPYGQYFGSRISTDLCGPFPLGIDGEKYAIVFHDSWSKYIVVYTLHDKSRDTVLEAFERFLREHQHLLSRGVDILWSDNGGEYQNKDMDRFLDEMCIKRNYTVPYNSWQNPYAERCWWTVLRPTLIALQESGMSDKFWPYFISQAALVHNVLCDDQCVSPHDIVYGNRFDYTRLHVPGCLCYYLLPERDRKSKLSPRAMPASYLGVDPERRGHIVYVHGLGRLTTAHHVVFNEHRYYDKSLDTSRVVFDDDRREHESSDGPIGLTRRHYVEERDGPRNLREEITDYHPADDSRHGTISTRDERGEWHEDHCENSECTFPRGHDGLCSHELRETRFRRVREQHYGHGVYSTCKNEGCSFYADHCGQCRDDFGKKLPSKLVSFIDDFNSVVDVPASSMFSVYLDGVSMEVASIPMSDVPCPKTYEEAQKSPLRERWWNSMSDEITALLKNKTWVTISRNDPRVRGRKPTKSRWVYAIKYNRDGTVSKFKSRFVVCGYSQRQGVDYDRAFSATLRGTTFRTLLSIAAGRHLRLMQIDVSNAFTQANLDDVDLFVEPPKGFEEYETVDGKRVSKLLWLKRALYGTKQASRLWQQTLQSFLTTDICLPSAKDKKFVQSKADPCVFRMYDDAHGEIIIGIYVDDIIVAYRGDQLWGEFQSEFHKRFNATPAHKLDWFLGMAIDQHEDYSVHVSHELSIGKIADKYIPGNQVTRDFPTPDYFGKLRRAETDVERAQMSELPYASLVGALLYIAVTSRPDIAYHTSILAKFLSHPSPECWKAAINLLQYLHSTRRKRLYFSGKMDVPDGLEKHRKDIERNHGFIAYSDSSWGNQYPYPMFGYSVYLYGGLVSFASKQLKTVAFSSCEAEYAAASYACKEIEFVRNICSDMGVQLHGRLVLAVDNTACIDIANDVGVSGRTKHFDRAIHYLRDLTQLRRVLPFFVTTHNQRADGYTKALDKSTFMRWTACVIT